jgi:hypothetical protein
MAHKITPKKDSSTVVVRTKDKTALDRPGAWWRAPTQAELATQILSTASLLKEQQQYRYRQASVWARLYGNMPLMGFPGASLSRMTSNNALPVDRPTMSVVTSCVDTLVSRLTQSRPRPVFLTDGGDYKGRRLAKQLNSFITGELYNCDAHAKGELILRDAAVLGTGVMKVLELDKRVALERKLQTEILVDPNDALYGDPRQMYELKLVDREVLKEMFPKSQSMIGKAEQAYPDNTSDSQKTVSDLVMVVEGWRLPSSADANDGLHAIACSEGLLFDESYKKDFFPFAFLHYSPRMLGFWGQGLAEQLMGTQVEINKLLMTISTAINLVGVPRVFVEDGSKVVKAQLNNAIGSIVTFRGTKPSYEVAPCVPQELYAQLERLIQYAYQQSGVSALSAASQKPMGLDSGRAIREYDDLQSDRFAALSKRYDNLFVDLAYLITDKAKDICERDGKYTTVYPNKDGTKEIDLPAAKLLKDTYVIQCFDTSSLPRDPAGRKQAVVEDMQAGLISPQEGRRLLNYPDLEQVEKLDNAAEERILKILDAIVEDGKYTPPDPFMDLVLAEKLVTQYYNLYEPAKLTEERCELLRQFASQVQALKGAVMTALAPPAGMAPQASPTAPPVSDMIPNVPQVQ